MITLIVINSPIGKIFPIIEVIVEKIKFCLQPVEECDKRESFKMMT